ncbi:alpha-amylase family glycosyl hydrolase [Bythopirellula polymerisocia]|nr:alpha-amylase family glycosyl hydrolase [Bythopirellula polymerisocia]
MYEVNLRAFSQAGDLAGVTARLEEIQSLGANTLWLMPIHPIGQLNSVGQLGSPYSVMDYGVVSSEYGALSDLSTLVTDAHNRGMFVLMDWVANHTAWDHQWINAHPDWYSQNAQGQIIHPPGTNWMDVADLNYNSAAMRSAMISEMQYWVADVGIDGFRADAADFVPFDFWQQAITAVRSATQRPLLMLAEGARTDHYDAGFDLTWSFGFFGELDKVFNSSGSARLLGLKHNQEFSQIPAGKSILRYTTNHDESAWNATPPVLFGGLNASLAAYAAVIAYDGTPLVYNGQEIGWSNNVPIFSKSPLDWSTGQSTSEWYSDLLDIRESHEALRGGALTDRSNTEVAMVLRENQDDRVLVLINTRNFSASISVPSDWQGEWIDQFTGNSETLTASYSLDAYEVLFLSPPTAQPGDFDLDGDVDGADFFAWQRGVLTDPPNALDLLEWQTNYGNPVPQGATATPVPEPASVGLLFFTCTVLVGISRRSHSWR